MIRISKNSMSAKVFTFLFSNFFILFFIFFLIFDNDDFFNKILFGLLTTVNGFFSWKLVFSDWSLILDKDNRCLVFKRGVVERRYLINDEINLKLEYSGFMRSNVFKYYYVVIGGEKFRIKYYSDQIDGPFLVWGSTKRVNKLERELISEIYTNIK